MKLSNSENKLLKKALAEDALQVAKEGLQRCLETAELRNDEGYNRSPKGLYQLLENIGIDAQIALGNL